MSSPPLRITFFFDENVSHRLRDLLVAEGHEVVFAVDYLATGTPDQIVASVAMQSPMILVTHDRDFRRFKTLLSQGGQKWIAQGAGKLQLSIHQADSVKKVKEYLRLIEFQYRECLDSGMTFYVEIKDSVVRLNTDPGR